MPQFEYCPPFSVFSEGARSVKPEIETNSLQGAVENLRTRRTSFLSVCVLVTENDVSTLIPVTVKSSDLDDRHFADAKDFIESCAEERFRALIHQESISAAVSL